MLYPRYPYLSYLQNSARALTRVFSLTSPSGCIFQMCSTPPFERARPPPLFQVHAYSYIFFNCRDVCVLLFRDFCKIFARIFNSPRAPEHASETRSSILFNLSLNLSLLIRRAKQREKERERGEREGGEENVVRKYTFIARSSFMFFDDAWERYAV